jgi:hypothetical protein
MADNNYRSRSNPVAHGAGAPARGQSDDPLAELARLIGQSDGNHGPAASFDDPIDAQDWAADERHAEPAAPADDRYVPRRPADPYPAYRDPPPREADYDAPPPAAHLAARRPLFNGARDDAGSYAAPPPRYLDPQEPSETRQVPAFLPRLRDDRYQYDDQEHGDSDDQFYAADDYEDEAPTGRRRGGVVIVAAVLGVAVLGTAGAFGYRAMFGGSMLPSLPPIIRADNSPNKILPSAGNSRAGASDQADAGSAGSGEKLVPRQENPVDVPAPVSAAPRVVSTIPVFPAPTTPPPGVLASGTPGFPAPVGPAAVAAAPAASAAPVPPAMAMPSNTPVAAPEPKKIHTVAIRPDQNGSTDAAAAPAPPPATRTAAPSRAAPAMAAPAARPAPQGDANAPLSILPSQGGAPTPVPAHTRTAVAQPAPLNPSAGTQPAATAGGGYAVQVSSQRSEAEAQTSFRALQAKFPTQLGGQQPMVRRADLGAKGVYYRALVGPFASMEQAAEVCSNLKAAGGICIVQRN